MERHLRSAYSCRCASQRSSSQRLLADLQQQALLGIHQGGLGW